mmetsp:Transcript_2631/g.5312  ORF Transcript_2631/g.5312 Transcript_2631/m.5312 type:complete len:200 (-) Transcript_2631:504-1103(-)
MTRIRCEGHADSFAVAVSQCSRRQLAVSAVPLAYIMPSGHLKYLRLSLGRNILLGLDAALRRGLLLLAPGKWEPLHPSFDRSNDTSSEPTHTENKRINIPVSSIGGDLDFTRKVGCRTVVCEFEKELHHFPEGGRGTLAGSPVPNIDWESRCRVHSYVGHESFCIVPDMPRSLEFRLLTQRSISEFLSLIVPMLIVVVG